MAQPFKQLGARLGSFLAPNQPLQMAPAQRSALVQHLLAQSQSPQGIVSPYGTANKALQGLLMRKANIAQQEEERTTRARQQGVAGALARARQPGARGEAAMRAALIIASGLPNDPVAQSLLEAQGESTYAPGSKDDLFGVVDPGDFTPESLQTFSETKRYGDLVPRENNIGRYTPGFYTAESWAKFIDTGAAADLVLRPEFRFQGTPSGAIVAGNTHTGEVTPTAVTPEAAIDEAARRKRAEGEASAIGEAAGKAQGMMLQRALNAGGIEDILDIADPLIDEATGSGTGAGADKLAAFFGISTTGAQAIAQLLPLQAALMLKQPRMEGPQSDRDVQLYQEAAGQIGDPTVPRETKKAAIRTIRRLQQQYKNDPTGSAPVTDNDPLGIR